MCIVCVEFKSEKLTLEEATKAFAEIRSQSDEPHIQEVEILLRDALDAEIGLVAELGLD